MSLYFITQEDRERFNDQPFTQEELDFDTQYCFHGTLKLHKSGHEYDCDYYIDRSIEQEVNLEIAHWLQYTDRAVIDSTLFKWVEKDEHEQGVLVLNAGCYTCFAEEMGDRFGHLEEEAAEVA